MGGLVDSFGLVKDGLRSCGVACDGVSGEGCESDEMGGEVGEQAVLISGFVWRRLMLVVCVIDDECVVVRSRGGSGEGRCDVDEKKEGILVLI